MLSTDAMNPTLTLTGLERGMRIPSTADSTISTKNNHQLAIHDAQKMFVWQSAFAVQFLNGHKQVQVKHTTFLNAMLPILFIKFYFGTTSNDNSGEDLNWESLRHVSDMLKSWPNVGNL